MKKPLINYLFAILLGVLLTFAFAPYEIFPFAILTMAGLFFLWLNVSHSLKQTFCTGYAFGLGLFGAGVSWVFTSIHVFGGVPVFFAVLITIGMIATLALFPAAAGWMTNRYFPVNTTQKLIFAFPAVWVLTEWLRTWLFSGFPWLIIGYSQTNSPLKGFAPLSSVYLVSLAAVISSALIVNAVLHYKQNNFRSLYYSLFALLMIWLCGGLLDLIPWTKPQGTPISAALVQGNVPQEIKWSPEHIQLSLDRYVELTQPLWGKYNIIIWPESAIPLPLQNVESFIDDLDKKAKENNAALILGIPIQTENGYYNAIVTLGNAKNQVYHKRHLVPFGEYVPFSNLLHDTLQFMNIPSSEMVPGKIYQEPLVINDIKILPSICYEITFPELTRQPDKSINLLLVLTNDAWFGKSNAEPQHLQMAAMRAIEFRKPLLFVSNDGITAVINENGQIEKAVPQRKTIVLEASVQPRYGITPWLTNGMTPVFIILFYLLFLTARAGRTEKAILQNQVLNYKIKQEP